MIVKFIIFNNNNNNNKSGLAGLSSTFMAYSSSFFRKNLLGKKSWESDKQGDPFAFKPVGAQN
jgi:hypothetical protein